jgi:hypothetical protein
MTNLQVFNYTLAADPSTQALPMTNEEKISLKAACLQAATTLIAARDSVKGAVDVDKCVKLDGELYCRLTVTKTRLSRRTGAGGAGLVPPRTAHSLDYGAAG